MQWQDVHLLCSSTAGCMLNLSEIQSLWKRTPGHQSVKNRPMILSGSVCPKMFNCALTFEGLGVQMTSRQHAGHDYATQLLRWTLSKIDRWIESQSYQSITPGVRLRLKTRTFFIEIFACPKRSFSGNYMSKRQAGRVLAKSLAHNINMMYSI